MLQGFCLTWREAREEGDKFESQGASSNGESIQLKQRNWALMLILMVMVMGIYRHHFRVRTISVASPAT